MKRRLLREGAAGHGVHHFRPEAPRRDWLGEHPHSVPRTARQEANVLRCQNVTSKRGGDRYGVLAFTEQGVAMLSSVLKSERAVEVNVAIMRTFVAMRKALASIAPLLARIEATDRRQIADQAKNDANQERNEERFKLIRRFARLSAFVAASISIVITFPRCWRGASLLEPIPIIRSRPSRGIA